MHSFTQRAIQSATPRAAEPDSEPSTKCGSLQIAEFLLATLLSVWVWPVSARCQEVGSQANVFQGNGVEISVSVRDSSGEPISSLVTVKLYRDGAIPSGEGTTSRGRLTFIVAAVGEFTVVVEGAGYQRGEKDVSAPVAMRVQADVVLRRAVSAESVTGVPGKPLLAPKAKEAFDRGLQALSADKLAEAEKHVGEAMRLAPGHPDVLYLQGVVDLKRHNYAEAQGALEKATQIDPNHARAFAALGMALANQGKYDAAIGPLEKSLQLDAAGGWETHWTLAKAYYQHERYDEALKTSQEALAESNGKAPGIELLVAQSLTAVGRYEDSAAALREFLKSHGDRAEAATARRWLERLTASGKIRAN